MLKLVYPGVNNLSLLGRGRGSMGLSLPKVNEAAAWTPADIANLAAFFWFKPGVGTCFTDEAGTTPAAAGDSIKNVTGLYGASILKATEGTNPPTLRADGMELDAAGVNRLVLSSPIPGDGAFTVYWSMQIHALGPVACFASHTTEASILGGFGGGIGIADQYTTQGETLLGIGLFPDALVLGRFAIDGYNGSHLMRGTEDGGGETGGGTFLAFPFDQLGGTGAVGAGNGDSSNRFRVLIWVNRHIAIDSAEDLLIRNWISANDGAEL